MKIQIKHKFSENGLSRVCMDRNFFSGGGREGINECKLKLKKLNKVII